MSTKLLIWFVFGVSFLAAATLPAGPMLVGHAGLKGLTLDDDGVKAVLLGKIITLGGTRVVIVLAREGDAQNAFFQSHLGMTTAQFQNFWRRLFMTGGGSAPRIVKTEADARELVTDTPGAIFATAPPPPAGLTVLAAD